MDGYEVVGPDGLGDAELIGLVAGGGRVGQEVIARFGSLSAVSRAGLTDLARVRGMGKARAVRLHAALSLGKRAARTPEVRGSPVTCGADAAAWFLAPLSGLDHEELHGLFLDRRMRPVAYRRLTTGGEAATVVDSRQILRVALEVCAHAIVVAHNHPSGDPTPSREDRAVTERLREAGAAVGIELLDHLVVAGDGWCSVGR